MEKAPLFCRAFYNTCKNLLMCYNKAREIPDVWSRQLSPHCLEFERKAVHNRCGRSYFIL